MSRLVGLKLGIVVTPWLVACDPDRASAETAVCGDGYLTADERCDDGGLLGTLFCSPQCQRSDSAIVGVHRVMDLDFGSKIDIDEDGDLAIVGISSERSDGVTVRLSDVRGVTRWLSDAPGTEMDPGFNAITFGTDYVHASWATAGVDWDMNDWCSTSPVFGFQLSDGDVDWGSGAGQHMEWRHLEASPAGLVAIGAGCGDEAGPDFVATFNSVGDRLNLQVDEPRLAAVADDGRVLVSAEGVGERLYAFPSGAEEADWTWVGDGESWLGPLEAAGDLWLVGVFKPNEEGESRVFQFSREGSLLASGVPSPGRVQAVAGTQGGSIYVVQRWEEEVENNTYIRHVSIARMSRASDQLVVDAWREWTYPDHAVLADAAIASNGRVALLFSVVTDLEAGYPYEIDSAVVVVDAQALSN